jgi:hypothetical protein
MTERLLVDPPSSAAKAAFRRRLSLRQRASLGLEILAAYIRVRRLLAQERLPAAVADLRDGVGGERTDGDMLLTGLRLGRAVGKTLRVLPADARCLVRSLVLVALLARRGIPASLVIGVKTSPGFAAHAWVEYGGVALLPSGDTPYSRLLEL